MQIAIDSRLLQKKLLEYNPSKLLSGEGDRRISIEASLETAKEHIAELDDILVELSDLYKPLERPLPSQARNSEELVEKCELHLAHYQYIEKILLKIQRCDEELDLYHENTIQPLLAAASDPVHNMNKRIRVLQAISTDLTATLEGFKAFATKIGVQQQSDVEEKILKLLSQCELTLEAHRKSLGKLEEQQKIEEQQKTEKSLKGIEDEIVRIKGVIEENVPISRGTINLSVTNRKIDVLELLEQNLIKLSEQVLALTIPRLAARTLYERVYKLRVTCYDVTTENDFDKNIVVNQGHVVPNDRPSPDFYPNRSCWLLAHP